MLRPPNHACAAAAPQTPRIPAPAETCMASWQLSLRLLRWNFEAQNYRSCAKILPAARPATRRAFHHHRVAGSALGAARDPPASHASGSHCASYAMRRKMRNAGRILRNADRAACNRASLSQTAPQRIATNDLPEFLRDLFRVIPLPFSKHARRSTKITVFGPTASATRPDCFFIKHRRPFTNTFSSSETGKEDYPA